MSETDLSNYKDDRERSESELDEGDRLKPEFVRAVLDAVEEGDAEAAYDRVEPLHPADIADLIELTPAEQRPALVDAVAPEDGSGAANVKVVRKVLQALQHKSFLLAQTVSEIEELLKERDTLPDNIGLSSPLDPSSTPLQPNSSSRNKMGAPQRLDKKQIETRIEEDRERHVLVERFDEIGSVEVK